MRAIPESAQRMVDACQFVPTEELSGGHCSYVWADETRVLKVPFQGEEMTSGYEMQALLAHHGIGPNLLVGNKLDGSMIMERAVPGDKLNETGLSDDQQIQVWRDLVWRIQQCEPGLYVQPYGPETPGHVLEPKLMPLRNYVDMKDRLCSHLIAWTSDEGFLHGDLHHENILKHNLGWVVIDAKGLKGDRAFEGAAYIRNPLATVGGMTPEQFRQRVIKVAAALRVEPFRVWGWSVACLREGGVEPGTPWHHVLKCLYEIAADFDGERFVEVLT